MRKKKAPWWLRWLYLAVSLFIPFAAWMDFQDVRRYHSLGIFSLEEWAEIIEAAHFRWAIQGLMTAAFLFQFLCLTWSRNGRERSALTDRLFSTAVLLVWAILPLLMAVPNSGRAIWFIGLIVLTIVVGRSRVTYFEVRRMEEKEDE